MGHNRQMVHYLKVTDPLQERYNLEQYRHGFLKCIKFTVYSLKITNICKKLAVIDEYDPDDM